MNFTKEEYIKLTDRFNSLKFSDQIQRIIDNPEILEMTITVRFKNIDPDIENKLEKKLTINLS